jgi:hypothetical protein
MPYAVESSRHDRMLGQHVDTPVPAAGSLVEIQSFGKPNEAVICFDSRPLLHHVDTAAGETKQWAEPAKWTTTTLALSFG